MSLYNEEGGEILKGPRIFDAAKRLLAESGNAGQPVTPRGQGESRRKRSSDYLLSDTLHTTSVGGDGRVVQAEYD